MPDPASSLLVAWENFYVIIGSSGAALIGLQFVVIVLIAEMEVQSSHAQVGAFGTPNVVHFAAALFVSATMSAPWPTISDAGILLGVCGLVGVGYVAVTLRRTLRQHEYQPVLEDWVWYAVIPFVAYAALPWAGFTLRSHVAESLFVIAGTALLLLFIGIHNAWDTVTYIVLDRAQAARAGKAKSGE